MSANQTAFSKAKPKTHNGILSLLKHNFIYQIVFIVVMWCIYKQTSSRDASRTLTNQINGMLSMNK